MSTYPSKNYGSRYGNTNNYARQRHSTSGTTYGTTYGTSASADIPRRIAARFDSPCSGDCGGKIFAGDSIWYQKSRGAFCLACAPDYLEGVSNSNSGSGFESSPTAHVTAHVPVHIAGAPLQRLEGSAPSQKVIVIAAADTPKLTLTPKCYCHVIKRRCGYCTAMEMAIEEEQE